jgi:cephalosporin-C deacetylase-like acetyl esterase
LPRSAEFTYWNGRDANNMLHCYLRTVRLTDYLRSREDVRHIWLFGASRSGPVMLAAAALAPEQVAAVNVHVPTSCGVSWKDRPYRGWGRPPSRTEEGLKTAAYFDPVNFAPDLEVPVVMDGGFYDGLSPIPGMLAFCNHATEAPFVRWSIEQGHHGYFTSGRRKELEADLAKHLAKHGIVPGRSDGQGDDAAAAD